MADTRRLYRVIWNMPGVYPKARFFESKGEADLFHQDIPDTSDPYLMLFSASDAERILSEQYLNDVYAYHICKFLGFNYPD